MNPIQGYHLIEPEDLSWRPSNLMKILNAGYLERTESENLGARLWRLPPKSANTLHKHIRQAEFHFALAGTSRRGRLLASSASCPGSSMKRSGIELSASPMFQAWAERAERADR